MKAIALRPQRNQLNVLIISLAVMTVLLFVYPLMVFPLAMLLPLFVCPLLSHKEKWIGYASIVFPCIASFYHGYPSLLCISLLLPGLLPALMQTYLTKHPKMSYVTQSLYMMLAVAVGLTSVLACFSISFGASLYEVLADLFVLPLASTDTAATFLSQLQTAGIVSFTGGDSTTSILTFLMDLTSLRQLSLSLHLAIENMLIQTFPGLFVQACLQIGLFTVLRNAKLNRNTAHVDHSDKTKPRAVVIKAPGFSTIALAPEFRQALWVCCFVSYLCMMGSSAFWLQFGLLIYGLFYHAFATQGAAIVVCCLGRKQPKRKTLAGVLVTLSYVMFPIALFFVGAMDSFFHFREKKVFQKKEEQ